MKKTVKAWAVFTNGKFSLGDLFPTREFARSTVRDYREFEEKFDRPRKAYRVSPITFTYDDGRGRER